MPCRSAQSVARLSAVVRAIQAAASHTHSHTLTSQHIHDTAFVVGSATVTPQPNDTIPRHVLHCLFTRICIQPVHVYTDIAYITTPFSASSPWQLLAHSLPFSSASMELRLLSSSAASSSSADVVQLAA